MTLKYVVCPDYVTSKNDGDVHFINASQLMRRYRVRPEECVTFDSYESQGLHRGLELIFLRPRFDGNYVIPKGA